MQLAATARIDTSELEAMGGVGQTGSLASLSLPSSAIENARIFVCGGANPVAKVGLLCQLSLNIYRNHHLDLVVVRVSNVKSQIGFTIMHAQRVLQFRVETLTLLVAKVKQVIRAGICACHVTCLDCAVIDRSNRRALRIGYKEA